MNATYVPISCEFHDLLEDLATTRQAAHIRFTDAEGVAHTRHTTVADVYARHGAEYVVIGTQETLRLDQLVSVGDAKLADF